MLGLLQDDKEWDEALTEGAATKMSFALRELFIMILLFCQPANPQDLFNRHFIEWADDFVLKALQTGVKLSETQIRTLVVLDIQQRLQSWDKDVKMLGLTMPTEEEMEDVSFSNKNIHPVLIREELEFDVEILTEMVRECMIKFTDSQKVVFEVVMEAIENGKQLSLFIDARGGTGKTFVLNAILAAARIIDGGSVGLALDRTLRDITGSDIPFGGKVVVLSGDFRQ